MKQDQLRYKVVLIVHDSTSYTYFIIFDRPVMKLIILSSLVQFLKIRYIYSHMSYKIKLRIITMTVVFQQLKDL